MSVSDFSINNYSLDADVNVFIKVIDKKKRVKQKICKHNKATRNMTEGLIRFLRGEFNTTFLREFKDTINNIGDNSEIARYFIPTHMGIGNIGIDLNTGEIPSGLVEFDHILDPSYSDTDLRSEILPENDPQRTKIRKSIKSEATLSDTYVLDVQGYYQFNQITNNNHPFKFVYANTLDYNPPTEVIEFTDPETGLSCITVTELGLYSGDINDNGSRLLARLLLSPLTPLIISQDDTVIINWQIGLKSLNEMILYNREYYDYQYQQPNSSASLINVSFTEPSQDSDEYVYPMFGISAESNVTCIPMHDLTRKNHIYFSLSENGIGKKLFEYVPIKLYCSIVDANNKASFSINPWLWLSQPDEYIEFDSVEPEIDYRTTANDTYGFNCGI